MDEQLFVFEVTHNGPDCHDHLAVIDEHGNGLTTCDGLNPHCHDVTRLRINDANGHNHILKERL